MKRLLQRICPAAASLSRAISLLLTLLALDARAGNYCHNTVPACDPTVLTDPPSACYQPPPPTPVCEPTKLCDKCTRSPCYVGSGVYTTEETDLEIGTTGFPITVSRLYQSSRAIDGESGFGWVSSLSARLYYGVNLKAPSDSFRGDDLEAHVRLPNGTLYRFAENADGTYAPPAGRFDTLVRNPDETWDLRLQRTRSHLHFSATGKLLRMVDDFGNTTEWTYAKDRLARVADLSGSGRSIDITWGADGRLSDVTDMTGRNVHYVYNGGALVSVTNPAGQTTSYGATAGKYGPLLNTITDHWGRLVTTVTFDTLDRVKSYTERGEIFSYSYTAGLTTKSDSSGHAWQYPFVEGGLVTENRPPGGGAAEHIDYDANGLVKMRTDPVGVKTRYTYNGDGNPLTVTHDYQGPTAVEWRYVYDTAFPDKVVSVTPFDPTTNAIHPHWQARKLDYYPPGSTAPGARHHVYEVESDGTTAHVRQTFTYDARGHVLTETDAGGSVVSYTYDAAGNLTTKTLPANNDSGTPRVVTYAHDTLGRTVSETNEAGGVTTFTWDELNRLHTRSDPKPAQTSPLVFSTTYFHDEYEASSGLLFSRKVDPNGRSTRVGFDQYAQVVQTIDPAGNITRNVFTKGLQTGQVDANNNTTTMAYDALHRLSTLTYPDSTFEQYSYFPDGMIASKRDRVNQTIAFAYDRHKRYQARTYPNGGAITASYQGQKLIQIVDSLASPSETHGFAWDDSFRLIANTQGLRGNIAFTYTDDRRHVATQTVAGGAATTYGYYPDGSVRTIEWSPVAGTFSYGYTPTGETESITFPSGQMRLYAYDDQGRATQVTNMHPKAGTLAAFSYGYDIDPFSGQATLLGMRTSVTATVPALGLAEAITNYGYDSRYNLDRAAYPAGAPYGGATSEWTYDALGDRLTMTEGGQTATYVYNKFNGNSLNSPQLASDGSNAYSYDAGGNTIARTGSRGTFTFSWDYENHLRSVAGDTSASYLYDYVGRRTQKTVNGTSVSYLYAGAHAIAESGAAAAEYLFGPGLDKPLAVLRNGIVYYFDVDALGSVVAVNDTAGTVLSSYAWDAWGTSRGATVGVPNSIGYTGREMAEAGYQFNRYRYYEASTGSFRSTDPIAGLGADAVASGRRRTLLHTSEYSYADNGPVMATDPLGLFSECEYGCARQYDRDRARCERDMKAGTKRCQEYFTACFLLAPEAFPACLVGAWMCEADNQDDYKTCITDTNADFIDCWSGCCGTPNKPQKAPLPTIGPLG